MSVKMKHQVKLDGDYIDGFVDGNHYICQKLIKGNITNKFLVRKDNNEFYDVDELKIIVEELNGLIEVMQSVVIANTLVDEIDSTGFTSYSYSDVHTDYASTPLSKPNFGHP